MVCAPFGFCANRQMIRPGVQYAGARFTARPTEPTHSAQSDGHSRLWRPGRAWYDCAIAGHTRGGESVVGDGTTTFGALLRQLRQRAGLSQEELAGRAGLTAKGIGALERGDRRHPYPHTVQALADA